MPLVIFLKRLFQLFVREHGIGVRNALDFLAHPFSSFEQIYLVTAIQIEPRLFSCSRLTDEGQMVDSDVPLNRVIALTVPDTGRFIQIEVVSKTQFFEARRPHCVRVMDDDLGFDVIATTLAFAQDRSDLILCDIVLVDQTSLVRQHDRTALVASEAFRRKNIIRKPELPPDASVRVCIFEDPARGQDWPISQETFGGEIRSRHGHTVEAYYTFEFVEHRCSSSFQNALLAFSNALKQFQG